MSGIEVIGCVAAVVSAFHGGAELVQIIKERKEKKRRRKEKGLEQAVQERMLHLSLVDGATQCNTCSMERHQRFGQAFDRGDAIATSELKDVVINLQGEVIRALQIAREVDNAILNLTQLHEASITNKNNAIRSMDTLCQRIVVAMPVQRQLGDDDMVAFMAGAGSYAYSTLQHRNSEESFDSFQTANLTLPAAVTIPNLHSASSSYPRLHSSRHLSDSAIQRATSMASQTSSTYMSLPGRQYDIDVQALRKLRVSDEAAGDVDRLVRNQLQDADSGGSAQRGISHRPANSISSLSSSENPVQSTIDPSSPRPLHDTQDSSTAVHATRTVSDASDHSKRIELTPSTSTASSNSSYSSPRASNTRSLSHPGDDYSSTAPELVTKEFESMLGYKQPRPTLQVKQPVPLSNIHPAFRDLFMDSPAVLGPDPEEVWSPLTRPAKHNNYHNFCKGAWQTRKALQEGLSISMIPNTAGKEVPHWKCKQCEFRSRAMNSSNVLPDQVYYHAKCGIRYRWLFLAKSHLPSAKSTNNVESYRYGCIFCAAEGRQTAIYEDLDALMAHIVSKHKTSLMPPEVMARTGCVIGGMPDRTEEWDIHLPLSTSRKMSGVVGEFLVTAITGVR